MNPSLIIKPHCLQNLANYLQSSFYSQAVFITHPSLWSLYEPLVSKQLNYIHYPFSLCLVPEGEKNKNLSQAKRCWQHLAKHHADRHSLIIAFGGGVICDLAGFAASCYMRGIDTLYLPTTLLAMVDAAIGGKTGINLGKGKNLIGALHQPKTVLIDPSLLKTLPEREYKAGFAEVIKYGVIDSPKLFEQIDHEWSKLQQKDEILLEQIIKESCSIKSKFVEEDFHDRGIRAFLNYGHTFGHALEALTGYKQYLHGEAVSIGMNCAARLSVHMGLADQTMLLQQEQLCQKIGLPIYLPRLSVDRLIELMKKDKKAVTRKISLILPKKIGKVIKISEMDPSIIKQALQN